MELANKVGAAEIIGRVVEDLKDDNEQYRKMVMETIELVSPLLVIGRQGFRSPPLCPQQLMSMRKSLSNTLGTSHCLVCLRDQSTHRFNFP